MVLKQLDFDFSKEAINHLVHILESNDEGRTASFSTNLTLIYSKGNISFDQFLACYDFLASLQSIFDQIDSTKSKDSQTTVIEC